MIPNNIKNGTTDKNNIFEKAKKICSLEENFWKTMTIILN